MKKDNNYEYGSQRKLGILDPDFSDNNNNHNNNDNNYDNKKKKKGKKVKGTTPSGYSITYFQVALNKLKTHFSQNSVTGKEKTYMRMRVQKPYLHQANVFKALSHELTSANFLLQRTSPGELTEIVIRMIPHTFVTSMVNTGIELLKMGYNELIGHLLNL